MITQEEIKFVKALQQKKYRDKNNCFVVEGSKMVSEVINSDFEIQKVYGVESWINKDLYNDITQVSPKILQRISGLKTPNEVLAVVSKPKAIERELNSNVIFAFDQLQDPGNLGTIIRTTDWFGFNTIVLSQNSVDVYNPKVIQSTMGSVFRSNVQYVHLEAFLKIIGNKYKVYAATLNGVSIHKTDFNEKSIVVFGNESRGISKEILSMCDEEITIPKFGQAESLNVSSSFAVIASKIAK